MDSLRLDSWISSHFIHMAPNACQLYSCVIPHRTFLPCLKLEIPMWEVFHDLLGLMEYILEELPLHVPALEDIFMKLKGGQDRLRAIDARFFGHIICTIRNDGTVSRHCQSISTADGDIRDSSHSRSPRVLRLYNVTFSLCVILFDLVGPSPKKVSARRFYGLHFHGITAHLADLF